MTTVLQGFSLEISFAYIIRRSIIINMESIPVPQFDVMAKDFFVPLNAGIIYVTINI